MLEEKKHCDQEIALEDGVSPNILFLVQSCVLT
jgi:hypothetical protein